MARRDRPVWPACTWRVRDCLGQCQAGGWLSRQRRAPCAVRTFVSSAPAERPAMRRRLQLAAPGLDGSSPTTLQALRRCAHAGTGKVTARAVAPPANAAVLRACWPGWSLVCAAAGPGRDGERAQCACLAARPNPCCCSPGARRVAAAAACGKVGRAGAAAESSIGHECACCGLSGEDLAREFDFFISACTACEMEPGGARPGIRAGSGAGQHALVLTARLL